MFLTAVIPTAIAPTANVLEEGKEKLSKTKKKDLQCKQCEYKCKLKSTLKKHMNTKHGATR